MKHLKRIFLLVIIVILAVVPSVNSVLAATESEASTQLDTSEVLPDKTTLPSDELTKTQEPTEQTEKPPMVDESSSSTEDQTTETIEKEPASSQEAVPKESANFAPQSDTEDFVAGIQSDENEGLVPIYLKDESVGDKVSVNWQVLKNDGYYLGLQLSDASTIDITSRKIEIVVPRGILVRKDQLQALVNDNSHIYNYSVKDMETIATYQLNVNFRKTLFVDPLSGTNAYSTDYVTGATIVFDVSPSISTLGFRMNLLPNYEDGTTNSPNFWTGVKGDSLVRNQPLKVKLIENDAPTKTLVMDDFIIPSDIEYTAVVRSPDGGSTGAVTLGPQTLDDELQMIIQPRVRNTTENPSSNAYYMSNVSFQAYLPYKPLTNNTYLSAELLTDKMDAWVAGITQANNGEQIISYSVDTLADGRTIVTYSMFNGSQEYLMNAVDLCMYYRLFSQENEKNQSFSIGEQLHYTQNNLGWIFRNYEYDENEIATITENTRNPLTNSTGRATITSDEAFDFSFINRSASYSPISVKGTQATTLLGNALVKNNSTALGTARATYKFDTETKWNYGVTTVQFWTVPADYGGSVAESRNYTYKFDFILQKKGAAAGEGQLTGSYSLKPSLQYQGVKISRSDGKKNNLLGYANERYYYYVNRQMLSGGTFNEGLPADFDSNDYYIKELSYDLEITSSGYISGDSGRPRESGGQFFGYTFGDVGSKGTANFEIKPAEGFSGNKLSGGCTTTFIDKTTNKRDVGLLLDDSGTKMTVKNENGQTLSTINHRVDVGKKVTVNASAIASYYTYGSTNYAPNPVFLIRTPIDFDLDKNSINLVQDNRQLNYTLDEPIVLDDDSKLYYLKPTDSDGLGYYNEDRELVGEAINVTYRMAVNIRARAVPISYRELLFVTDQKYAAFLSGSYGNSLVTDVWGIAPKLTGKAGLNTENGVTKLASTKLGNVFSTNLAELDFGYDTELSSNVVTDPSANKDSGVLDKETTTFNSKFFFKNIAQTGEVDNDGRFIFYLPVAKKGIVPEWMNAQQSTPKFSLTLKGKVTPISSKGVTYKVGYSTDRNKRFNNGQANFDGSAAHASYQEYDAVENNLDNVTMVKVIAERNLETGMIIPFGEELTAEMPLAYSPTNTEEFSVLAGQTAYWTPYVSLIYTMNGSRNEFTNLAPENSMRIRYRPEPQVIDIWAYNSDDYLTGEAEGMNKTAAISLPSFVNKYDLQINQLASTSLKDMVLASVNEILADPNKPTSYGNTTFGFNTGLNIADIGSETDPKIKDLSLALSNTLALGQTSTTNQLNYKIYNTKNINDTIGEKKVTLRYSSVANEDLLFDIVLNIKRKASKIEAHPALVAGKVYREFTSGENNITTLEDGAFTIQVAYDILDGSQLPSDVKEKDIYLSFGTTASSGSATNALPVGDTILMKVQSTGENGDRVKPEYYYYKNNTASAQSRIELTSFVKMGTDNTHLTLADIKRHINEAKKLSYLFVFDFANEDASISSTDTIGLHLDFNESSKTERQRFIIEPKRSITNAVSNSTPVSYHPHEPIQLNGRFTLTDIGSAVDSFNKEKSLALNLALYEVDGSNKTLVDWPQGVLLQNANNPGTLIRPKNVDGKLQFIYPAEAIANVGTNLPYQLTLFNDVQPFAAGKSYEIKVSGVRSQSATYPLNDEVLDTEEVPFSIVPAEQTGIQVISAVDAHLLYSKTSNQQVALTFDSERIRKIVPKLQRKLGANYQPAAWSELIETPLPAAIDPQTIQPFTIKFQDQLDESFNGEYRIVFEAYRSNTETEPLYETTWPFLIWNPPG
ncbi:hypothetical protein [Candidatus Enterococcus ferrettii]|uniref:Uncharacterized protein n=1 Tax=Candidatus Enterococcus ferrettii TaxID=2815324 RepID=A0ABV0EQ51_9ENTE|nr:hypothetical protein [Enterococcus sp. 665A]MBO1339733.1 hypothetical protein [Enterococcus sp. 665A]